MPEVKITVLRRTQFPDLASAHLKAPASPCPLLQVGQAFIVGPALQRPDGFCDWAWNDLLRFVTVLSRGGNFSTDIFADWMRDDRAMIACCTDGIRPVIFKIERLEG